MSDHHPIGIPFNHYNPTSHPINHPIKPLYPISISIYIYIYYITYIYLCIPLIHPINSQLFFHSYSSNIPYFVVFATKKKQHFGTDGRYQAGFLDSFHVFDTHAAGSEVVAAAVHGGSPPISTMVCLKVGIPIKNNCLIGKIVVNGFRGTLFSDKPIWLAGT